MSKVKRRLMLCLKWIGIVLLALILLAILFVLCARGITYLGEHISTKNGLDEGVYVELGGQEQFLRIRGEDVQNPVIIYLHGGPAGPDGYISYSWQRYLVDEYTFINWDQRGCGRTYYRSDDPNNETASFAQALLDLDDLVRYATERFQTNQVILLGHSYGTLLGSRYARIYPEHVGAYVGVGQFVSMESEKYSYQDALARAEAQGEDTAPLEAAYSRYIEGGDLSDLMALRGCTAPYHQAPRAVSAWEEFWTGLRSPFMSLNDLRWYLKPILDMDGYFQLNAQLFTYLPAADLRQESLAYQMPVYLISGDWDWTTPVQYAQDYMDSITAPDKAFFTLEGCGHYPQMDDPEGFCRLLSEALSQVDL